MKNIILVNIVDAMDGIQHGHGNTLRGISRRKHEWSPKKIYIPKHLND